MAEINEADAVARAWAQAVVLANWETGKARTCSVCKQVFLTKKDCRIHRAHHRKKDITCEKTVTT